MQRTILFLSLLTVVLAGRAQTLGERLWSTAATTRKAACFAFAAKTNQVAVVSDDGWTQILSVDDQIVVRAFPGPLAFKCNLSPDGQRLLLETTNGVSVMSTLDGRRLFALECTLSDFYPYPNRLAVAHDWSAAAAPLPEVGTVRVWSLADGGVIRDRKVAEQSVSVFGLANGGRKALLVKSPWSYGSIALADLEAGTQTQLMEGNIQFAAFDESSERVAVIGDSSPSSGLWRVTDAAFLGEAGGAIPWFHPPKAYGVSSDLSLIGFGDWWNIDTQLWPGIRSFREQKDVRGFPYFHPFRFELRLVAFSGNNQVFGILHGDGALHFWSVFGKSSDPWNGLTMAQVAIGEPDLSGMLPRLLNAAFSTNGTGVLSLRRDDDDWKGELRSSFGTRDAVSGRVLTRAGRVFPENYWATDGGFSADERVLWSVGEEADHWAKLPSSWYRLWVRSPQQTFSRALSKATIGALSRDGTRFAWGETNRVFGVHLDGTNPEPQPVPLTEAGFVAKALCFSTDGSLLAAGGPAGQLAVWNVTSGTVALSTNVSAGNLSVLKFSADGTRLLCGDSQGMVAVFDLATRQVMNRIAASTHSLTRLALSPDERVLVLADADNEVTQWSFPDGRRLAGERFFGSPITALDMSPDGGRLLVAQLRTELSVVKLPPVILRAEWVDGELELEWASGTAPFKLQRRGRVDSGEWHEVGPDSVGRTMRIPAEEASGFVRVLGAD